MEVLVFRGTELHLQVSGQVGCRHWLQSSCRGEWPEKWETWWCNLNLLVWSRNFGLVHLDLFFLVLLGLVLGCIGALVEYLLETVASFLKLELVGQTSCLGFDQNEICWLVRGQLLDCQGLEQALILLLVDGIDDGRVLFVGLLVLGLWILLLGVDHLWYAVVHFRELRLIKENSIDGWG